MRQKLPLSEAWKCKSQLQDLSVAPSNMLSAMKSKAAPLGSLLGANKSILELFGSHNVNIDENTASVCL